MLFNQYSMTSIFVDLVKAQLEGTLIPGVPIYYN